MPIVLWQVDAKLERGTVFSITPALCTTNPPLDLGLVRLPPQGYICEGNEPCLRKQTILLRQKKAMSTDHHYSVAFTPSQASSFTQQSIR